MNTPELRRYGLAAVRVAFAAVLLTWLVRSGRLDLEAITSLRPDPRGWLDLGLAALAVVAGMFTLAIRLRWLLRHSGLDVSLLRSIRATWIGAFFGTLLPGLVGGDVAKATMLCRRIPEGRRRAISAVMTDRLLGLYSLFVLAACGVTIGYATGRIPGVPREILLLPFLVAVGGPAALLAGMLMGRRLRNVVPDAVLTRVEPLLTTLQVLAASPRILVGSVALGTLNHLLSVYVFLVAARVLGVPLGPAEHLALDPLALTLNAIPVSPGGLGLAEGGFSWLYEAAGSPDGAAVGVVGRLVHYAVFVAGGLLSVASSESFRD